MFPVFSTVHEVLLFESSNKTAPQVSETFKVDNAYTVNRQLISISASHSHADDVNWNNNNIASWITTTKEDSGTPHCDFQPRIKSVHVPTLYTLSLSSLEKLLTHYKKEKNLNNGHSVINLSSFQLKPDHMSLLSKSLSFCPTPGEPDFGKIHRDLDKFHHRVLLKSHFEKDFAKVTAWKEQSSTKQAPKPQQSRKLQL